MKNWSVTVRLVLGFGWLIVGMVVGTGAALLALRSMHRMVDELGSEVVAELSYVRDLEQSITKAHLVLHEAEAEGDAAGVEEA